MMDWLQMVGWTFAAMLLMNLAYAWFPAAPPLSWRHSVRGLMATAAFVLYATKAWPAFQRAAGWNLG